MADETCPCFFPAMPMDSLPAGSDGNRDNVFILEQPEIFLRQQADAFMDSHGADNGFHAGCAQQMEADSSLLEQVHAEMVDRCIAVHQYEALSGNCRSGRCRICLPVCGFQAGLQPACLLPMEGRYGFYCPACCCG